MNEPIQYRDLTIHQRITAKANAVYLHHWYVTGVMHRIVKRDPGLYCPNWPMYHIHFKTNEREP